MNLNMNRVIDIKPTNLSLDPEWKSWRDNVSHILKSGDIEGNKFLSPGNDRFIVNKDVHLLMDKDPKVFKSNNKFDTPIDKFLSENKYGKKASRILSLAKTGVDAGSALWDAISGGKNSSNDSLSKTWQPWGQDMIAWSGAKGGVNFEYEFNFSLGQYGIWNALEEVVKPVINLVIPALPRNIGTFTMTGPFPNAFGLIAKMGSEALGSLFGKPESSTTNTGNSGTEGIDNTTSEDEENNPDILQKIGDFINETLLNSFQNFSYTVKFGNIMTFERVIITNATANFSNKVDQYGWPVKGSATLSFQGMVPIAVSAPGDLMTTRFGRE